MNSFMRQQKRKLGHVGLHVGLVIGRVQSWVYLPDTNPASGSGEPLCEATPEPSCFELYPLLNLFT